MGDAIEIREFRESDLDAIVEFSLRAWDPVFTSLREVLGDPIFIRLKPDWKAAQAEEVRASCTSGEDQARSDEGRDATGGARPRSSTSSLAPIKDNRASEGHGAPPLPAPRRRPWSVAEALRACARTAPD